MRGDRWGLKEWLWVLAVFVILRVGLEAINKWVVHLPGFTKW